MSSVLEAICIPITRVWAKNSNIQSSVMSDNNVVLSLIPREIWEVIIEFVVPTYPFRYNGGFHIGTMQNLGDYLEPMQTFGRRNDIIQNISLYIKTIRIIRLVNKILCQFANNVFCENYIFDYNKINLSQHQNAKWIYNIRRLRNVPYNHLQFFPKLVECHCILMEENFEKRLTFQNSISNLEIINFNSSLGMVQFPPKIKKLCLPNFDKEIYEGEFPITLEIIKLEKYSNISLTKEIFHEGIKQLHLPHFSIKCDANIFPSSLTEITIGWEMYLYFKYQEEKKKMNVKIYSSECHHKYKRSGDWENNEYSGRYGYYDCCLDCNLSNFITNTIDSDSYDDDDNDNDHYNYNNNYNDSDNDSDYSDYSRDLDYWTEFRREYEDISQTLSTI